MASPKRSPRIRSRGSAETEPKDLKSWLRRSGAMGFETIQRVSKTLVRRETIKQRVAAGALEVGLRAAAVRLARGVRAVPGFRGVVIAQANAVGMPDHRRPLYAARPVLADAVLARCERGAVWLRSRQHVMAVRRIAATVDDLALLAQHGLFCQIIGASVVMPPKAGIQ